MQRAGKYGGELDGEWMMTVDDERGMVKEVEGVRNLCERDLSCMRGKILVCIVGVVLMIVVGAVVLMVVVGVVYLGECFLCVVEVNC